MGPPSGQDPFLDTYRNSIINYFLKQLDHPKISRKKNLTKNIRPLGIYTVILISLFNHLIKGGSKVIMITVDYVKEAQRQLFN